MKITLPERRVKYLLKLVESVTATAKKNRITVGGEECIAHDWVDVELLCAVIAEDVLGLWYD